MNVLPNPAPRSIAVKLRAGLLAVTALTLLGLFACQVGADEKQPFHGLIDASSQRLLLADTVALSKWSSKKPVEDPARETAVIDAASYRAGNYGLEGLLVRRFFAAQIEANKTIQYSRLSDWRRGGAVPAGSKPDLNQVRISLDRLDTSLLVQLSGARSAAADPDCVTKIAVAIDRFAVANKFDSLHRIGLERALGAVCRSEQANTMAQGLSGRLSQAVFL
jgi:chorismate mutase